MTEAFLRLFNLSISAGWLVLAVVVLRLLLRKAPAWTRVLLWGVVGLRLVLPVSVESALSLIPSAETLRPEVVQFAARPTLDSGVPALNAAVDPVLGEAFAAAPGASANPLYLLTAVASVVWLAGLAGMLVYALVSWVRLRRRVRAAVPLEKNVYLCDEIDAPFLLGAVRPRIYLPSGLDEAARAHVLAHERAHLARRDHWWKPLGFLLLSVYWFQPLLWLAYALFCRDVELACDERAVRGLDAGAVREYCAVLLACSAPRRMAAACPLAFGEVGVKTRVRRALARRRPAVWVTAAAVVVCAVVAVCFLTDPKPSAEGLPAPFGRGYGCAQLTCQPLTESMRMTEENAPTFWLSDEDGQPALTMEDFTGVTYPVVPLEETRLTRASFDRLFFEALGWQDGLGPRTLRRRCAAAWTGVLSDAADGAPNRYTLLQQDDGTLYLAMGYQLAPDAPDRYRWVFRLRAAGTPTAPSGTYYGDDGSTLWLTPRGDGGYDVQLGLYRTAWLENGDGVYDAETGLLSLSAAGEDGGALTAAVLAAETHLCMQITASDYPNYPAGTVMLFYPGENAIPWRPWSGRELLEAFAAQEPDGQALAWVGTPDAAEELVGVVLFTQPEEPELTQLMFLDKRGIGQVCGLRTAPAAEPALTYAGGGAVSFRLLDAGGGIYTTRVRFSHSAPDAAVLFTVEDVK